MRGIKEDPVDSTDNLSVEKIYGRNVSEVVEAGRHNKVEYKVRRWKSKPWMKKILRITPHLPMFMQQWITRALRSRGTYSEWEQLAVVKNLLTDNGRDLLHNTGLQATGQPAGGQFVALSSDTNAPATGDTTLTGEITTPAGLARASAAYAHTGGTNTSTLIKTFTNDGGAPVADIQRSATFNASSAGTIGFSNTFTLADLEVNDQLQVTWTITIG